MAHAGLVSLAQTIDQLLNHAHSPIDNLPRANQESIMCIRDHTLFLQSSLPVEADASLEGHIREVANAAEDVIDDLLLDHGPRSSAAGAVDGKLKRLVNRFESTTGAVMGYMKSNNESAAGDFNISSVRSMEDRAGVVVGFEKDLLSIQERIIKSYSSSLSGLQVLPIVGMGGIGKTTLAKLFYESPLTQEHFDVRCWVTVSQDYSVASVVSSLVASMKGSMKLAEGVDEMGNYLRERRYLVVVDDMWSKKAWDDVRKLLPDNDHGSAIILTTRNQDVAVYANHPSTNSVHTVKPLDLDASWELLERWVFNGVHCPLELEMIGRRIAEKCRGLPLSITVMGGLLGFESTYTWQRIEESSDGQVEELISLSYTHLPHHLKSCFLYMGGFPEDYQIHASELIGLWVAEGFVNNGSEDEAEAYLKDLIYRGLVLCSSRKFDGKAKYCSLHDIVRDFCIRQGQREKLLVPVMDYLPTPILRRHFLSLVLKNYKRISTTCSDLRLKNDSVHTHASRAHSIICIPQKAGYKRATTSVGDFSLLRVLHVLRKDDYCDWEPSHDVFNLVYLTYLASNIPSALIPPVISKLQNLHTLILYKSEVLLPVEIWGLRRLRHLIAFSFRPLPHPEEEALPLQNLQTLSLATDFVCSERMVEMIPNAKKLGISYSAEPEPEPKERRTDDEGYLVENLTRHLRLEELKLDKCTSFCRQSRWNPVFPKSLKKLVLSGGWLSWRDMKLVGSLPSLQVLKLKKYACEGEEWETCYEEFVELRVLVIDESDLQYWISSNLNFPELKCLKLHRCPHLSEIPTDFAFIPFLELIEIDEDNESLLYSAKKIQEEQMEFGNDSLQVRVKRF